MIILTADQYEKVGSLFGIGTPNLVMARAVLQRKAPGKVWSDSQRHVSLVKVAHWCLLGGTVTQEVFERTLELLQDERPFSLVVPSDAPWAGYISRADIKQVPRRHFTWPEAGVVSDQHVEHLEQMKQALPVGYQLARIDSAIFPACAWQSLILRACKSADEFVRTACGFAVLYGGKVVSEAYALFVDETYAELATVTADDHQRRGLSKAVGAAVAQECLRRGLRPTWSCHSDNPASAKVARGLGLLEDPSYIFAQNAT